MGTNYYLKFKPCPHCGLTKPEMHIGKSSGGWHFALHVEPEQGIKDLDDWRKLFSAPAAVIRDEYGKLVAIDEMIAIITDRKWLTKQKWTQREYDENDAEPGLNNLVRSKIERFCISHGAGTWDCIVGEFS